MKKKKTALLIFIIFIFPSFYSYGNYKVSEVSYNSKSFTIVLTHLLDKKLEKNAYFYFGDQAVWELDFRNGDKIKYTIISMNPDNLMCGITARDNLGDLCEICITKLTGDNTKVEFKYNGKRMTFKGYFLR